jgi:hypothetical protein
MEIWPTHNEERWCKELIHNLTLWCNSTPIWSANTTNHTSNESRRCMLLWIETKSTTNGQKVMGIWPRHYLAPLFEYSSEIVCCDALLQNWVNYFGYANCQIYVLWLRIFLWGKRKDLLRAVFGHKQVWEGASYVIIHIFRNFLWGILMKVPSLEICGRKLINYISNQVIQNCICILRNASKFYSDVFLMEIECFGIRFGYVVCETKHFDSFNFLEKVSTKVILW